jgi:hypothetical protein
VLIRLDLVGFDENVEVTYDQATGVLKVGGVDVAKLGAGTDFDVDPTDGTADWEII